MPTQTTTHNPDAIAAIRRVLTLWDSWRRRADVCSREFVTAVEAMRELLPFEEGE